MHCKFNCTTVSFDTKPHGMDATDNFADFKFTLRILSLVHFKFLKLSKTLSNKKMVRILMFIFKTSDAPNCH